MFFNFRPSATASAVSTVSNPIKNSDFAPIFDNTALPIWNFHPPAIKDTKEKDVFFLSLLMECLLRLSISYLLRVKDLTKMKPDNTDSD
jgi:hypothetical protein